MLADDNKDKTSFQNKPIPSKCLAEKTKTGEKQKIPSFSLQEEFYNHLIASKLVIIFFLSSKSLDSVSKINIYPFLSSLLCYPSYGFIVFFIEQMAYSSLYINYYYDQNFLSITLSKWLLLAGKLLLFWAFVLEPESYYHCF